MRLELHSVSADRTRAIGEAIGELVRAGDAIALTGELGAGKTTLVQGLARGLGIDDQIVSPTFTLVREYRGRLHLLHADVYRLERVQDVIDLGLDEDLAEDGVLVVEWGDAIDALLPEHHLTIELTTAAADGSAGWQDEPRRLVLAGEGSWDERLTGLAGTFEGGGRRP
ncbi:MAG: tRNA (adenosine(37)-N6)-threonylcarbamoyltransferase complex ATPase subunit type 1 TsaE [Actinomycetota bacterium]